MSSAKKQSIVWQYFIAIPEAEKAKCNLCGSLLTYKNSTSSLRNHLSFKHPAISLYKTTCPQSFPSLDKFHVPATTNSSPGVQVSEPLNSADLYVESFEWDSLTNSLVELCTTDLLPLNITQGSGFQSFCLKLDPNCIIPSNTTIHNQLLSYYSTVKDSLVLAMKGHSKLSFSLENWVHSSGETYSTVRVHFIDSDWVQKSRVLSSYSMADVTDCPVKFKFLSAMDNFDISNNSILVVTSSCPDDVGFPIVSCLGSALEQGIRKGLDMSFMTKILNAATKLTSHIQTNSHAFDAFRNKQRQLNLPEKELLKFDANHWLSIYVMLQRMLEQRLAVISIINDRGIIGIRDARQYEILEVDWSTIEDVVRVLEPFKAVTSVLKADTFPTAGIIYPVVTGLVQIHLKVKATDSLAIKSFKATISKTLQEVYSSHPDETLVTVPPVVSSAVDPRFKQLKFFSETQRCQAWDHILRLLVELKRSDLRDRKRQLIKTDDTEEPESKRARTMEFLLGDYSDFSDVTNDVFSQSKDDPVELSLPSPSDVREDAIEELERFKCEVISRDLRNPFEWWKSHHRQYPLLCRLALQYLCIPATSRPTDQMYSDTDDHFNVRRSTLDQDTLDQILFIRDIM